MASALKTWMRKGSQLLTPSGSSGNLKGGSGGNFSTASNERGLFTKVDPTVDGPDCDHDCDSCTISYPAKFSIDEDSKIYGEVKGWSTHLIVATGKTDWVRDSADEKGSIMEAVEKSDKPTNGKMKVSASNVPVPDYADAQEYPAADKPTSVLLLPAFTIIDHVTPKTTGDLIRHIVSTAPTNTSPLPAPGRLTPSPPGSSSEANPHTVPEGSSAPDASQPPAAVPEQDQEEQPLGPTSLPADLPFQTRPCPHDVLILMCSQKTRDARCGQSAPLLKREFERHLRPLGLYRDDHDDRPGGVGIYFIDHVGGHKFSANVMVYRRAGIGAKAVTEGGSAVMEGGKKGGAGSGSGQAAQCIWLARVKPQDCEGIVKYTVLQGKVVKPESQLRGGFDREKGVISW